MTAIAGVFLPSYFMLSVLLSVPSLLLDSSGFLYFSFSSSHDLEFTRPIFITFMIFPWIFKYKFLTRRLSETSLPSFEFKILRNLGFNPACSHHSHLYCCPVFWFQLIFPLPKLVVIGVSHCPCLRHPHSPISFAELDIHVVGRISDPIVEGRHPDQEWSVS